MERGRITDKLVKISLEDLERLFAVDQVGYEKVMKVIRELCDPEEIYLQRHDSNSPYKNAGLSPFHPLGMLYLVRKFRDLGLEKANVFKKMDYDVRDTPNLLVSTGESFYQPKVGYWKLLVKPKKDLKIEYPCEARWEDGNIVIIDEDGFEKVLAGTR